MASAMGFCLIGYVCLNCRDRLETKVWVRKIDVSFLIWYIAYSKALAIVQQGIGMAVHSGITLVFSRPRGSYAEPAFRHMVSQVLEVAGGLPALIVPHLYDVVPQGPVFEHLRRLATDMILLAPMYPRAAQLVLRANGLRYRLARQIVDQEDPQGQDDVRRLWAFDYREYGSFEVLQNTIAALSAEYLSPVERSSASRPLLEEIQEEVHPRWYPVLDDEACVNCFECLNYCLFGVYDVNKDGRVFTAQPDQCRPGCPACARVCPTGAIVFPLYPDAKIAGGEPAPEDSQGHIVSLGDLKPRFSEEGTSQEDARVFGSVPKTVDGVPSGSDQETGGRTVQAHLPQEAASPEKETLQKWLQEAEDDSGQV